MKNVSTLFLLIAAFPCAAADLYGRVWFAPNSTPAVGAIVHITCPGNQSQPATVDNYGRYRLAGLPVQKKCDLYVESGGRRTESMAAYSGSGSKSMNIELHQLGNGLRLVFR